MKRVFCMLYVFVFCMFLITPPEIYKLINTIHEILKVNLNEEVNIIDYCNFRILFLMSLKETSNGHYFKLKAILVTKIKTYLIKQCLPRPTNHCLLLLNPS